MIIDKKTKILEVQDLIESDLVKKVLQIEKVLSAVLSLL